jgi:hypothetical protein
VADRSRKRRRRTSSTSPPPRLHERRIPGHAPDSYHHCRGDGLKPRAQVERRRYLDGAAERWGAPPEDWLPYELAPKEPQNRNGSERELRKPEDWSTQLDEDLDRSSLATAGDLTTAQEVLIHVFRRRRQRGKGRLYEVVRSDIDGAIRRLNDHAGDSITVRPPFAASERVTAPRVPVAIMRVKEEPSLYPPTTPARVSTSAANLRRNVYPGNNQVAGRRPEMLERALENLNAWGEAKEREIRLELQMKKAAAERLYHENLVKQQGSVGKRDERAGAD